MKLLKKKHVLNCIRNRSLPVAWLACVLATIACQSPDTPSAAELTKEMPKATIVDVERGIRNYIKAKTAADDGYFQIQDDSTDLNLRLVRVHTEYLSVLGEGHYFACVDLADTSGDVYDVDFFLAGNPDSMAVTETTVHKLNGKPYYAWEQQADKTWERVPVSGADSRLLGVIEGEDAFDFFYEVTLPEIKEESALWLPLAQEDAFQQVEIKEMNVPGESKQIEDEANGNKVLYTRLLPEDGGKKISIIYQVNRQEKMPYSGERPKKEEFQSSTLLLPIGGKFSQIVRQTLKGKEQDSKLMQARALYDYVIDNVRYAKQGKYGTGDANYACEMGTGNCTEFHSLFISLARTAGIPARFAIGAAIPSERNEGGVNGYHCWAEFYAEDKWWPVDISEANKYTALATYYFGHHPANRIEFSRGRDIQLDPGPQNGPIPFFAYPILETDGKQQILTPSLSFERKQESKLAAN